MLTPEKELEVLRGLLEALESRSMSIGMHPKGGQANATTKAEIACLKDEIAQLESMIERRDPDA